MLPSMNRTGYSPGRAGASPTTRAAHAAAGTSTFRSMFSAAGSPSTDSWTSGWGGVGPTGSAEKSRKNRSMASRLVIAHLQVGEPVPHRLPTHQQLGRQPVRQDAAGAAAVFTA